MLPTQAAVREARTVTLTNSKPAVQVCDARNDDSSTAAGYIIKTALRKAGPVNYWLVPGKIGQVDEMKKRYI